MRDGPIRRLSVLDQSPVPEGLTPGDALRNTLDLARLADDLGYHRYWLAEHHASRALAGAAPEVLIGQVAAVTERIRVGSGGVMLSHYSALKVVEWFRVLHAMFPGRIDLGLGRAPGSDQLTAAALQRDHQLPRVDDFPRTLAEVLAFLGDGFEADHPFHRIDPSPQAPGGPEVWLLGSSGYSAAYAAHLGLPFCSALFINPVDAEDVSRQYLETFRPTDEHPEPQLAIAASVLVADDHDEADRLASSLRLWRLRLAQRGDPGPIPSVAEALAHDQTPVERDLLARQGNRLIAGSPGEVRTRLEELAAAHGADEVVAVTITHSHEARRRSYELLAKAFDLG
ncbi:MAG: class flavin-dependent oxidoreductase [Acidimicrobiales bacterium]|nr:class flavin-dependent oxidoreductase [Acidimicrobiales bacterium]